MSFSSTIKQWIGRLFGISEAPVQPDSGMQSEKVAISNLDLSQAPLRLDDQRKRLMTETADDSPYWWHCPKSEAPAHPEFEAVNNAEVRGALARKIEAGSFSLIEIPDNIMKTVTLLNNQEFDYSEVAKLINSSPALAGEFLKIVNSALYNRGTNITDLRFALSRLGRENVKATLYLCSARLSFAKHPLFNAVASSVVDHCQTTGLIANYISGRYFPDPDLAFLAGFMHDIGKLAILRELSDEYDLPPEVPSHASEDIFADIFPGVHEQVGVYLGQHWHLGIEVQDAIAHHHDFYESEALHDSEASIALSAVVSMSDTMARILKHGRHISDINIWRHPACDCLNIARDNSTIEFFSAIPELLKRNR